MNTYGTAIAGGPLTATPITTTRTTTSHDDPFARLEAARARNATRGITLTNKPDPDAQARLIRLGLRAAPGQPPPAKPKPKPRRKPAKARRTGPPRPPGPRGGPAPAEALSWDVEAAATLAADGWTAMQLAEKYGVTPTTVRYQMKRRSIPLVNQKHTPKYDHDAMLTMAADGHTSTEIAQALGCSRKAVYSVLHAHHGPQPRPNIDTAEAIALHEQGNAIHEVAAQLRVSPSTIRRRFRLAGYTARDDRPTNSGRRTDLTGAITAYRDGATIPTLAEQHGTTPKTIRAHLRNAGVELRDDRKGHSGGANKAPRAMVNALITAYTTDGLSATAAAEKAGLSLSAALRYLHTAGVPIRPSSEVQTGRVGKDGATGLRQLMEANNTTAADVRAWAAITGRDCPAVGTPSRALVEDYLTHNRTTTPKEKTA